MDPAAAGAAARLATANALVSARRSLRTLARARPLVLAAYVDASPGTLTPGLLEPALRLLAETLGGPPPALWLRPARSLAGGMPVEVELILEVRRTGRRGRGARTEPRPAGGPVRPASQRRRRRPGAGGAARGRPRSAGRAR
jgi:hypothetical protein